MSLNSDCNTVAWVVIRACSIWWWISFLPLEQREWCRSESSFLISEMGPRSTFLGGGLHDVTHAIRLLWSLINEKPSWSLTLLMPWLGNKDVLRSRSPLLANCPGFFLVPHWHEIYQIALVCIIQLQINIIIPQFETFCLENIFMNFNISCWQFKMAWNKTAILYNKHTHPLIQIAQN